MLGANQVRKVMAIVDTRIENGKTVRVWQESRGKKTLEKTFYLMFEVMVCTRDGRIGVVKYHTLKEARKRVSQYIKDLGAIKGLSNPYDAWRERNTACTTIDGKEYVSNYGHVIHIYTCGGETISERIF